MPVVKVDMKEELIDEVVRKYRKGVSEAVLQAVEDALKKKGVRISEQEVMEALDRHFIQIAKEVREFLTDFVKRLSESASVNIEYSGEMKKKIEELEKRIESVETEEKKVLNKLMDIRDAILTYINDFKKLVYEDIEKIRKQVKQHDEKINGINESVTKAHRAISGLKGYYAKEISPVFLEVRKKVETIEKALSSGIQEEVKEEIGGLYKELDSVVTVIEKIEKFNADIEQRINDMEQKVNDLCSISKKEKEIVLLALELVKEKIGGTV